jgi:MFS family permease
MFNPVFRNLHPTTRTLLWARTLRSIGQGALVVDFTLYLHTLGWSGLAIGLVLSGGTFFGAGLSLIVGLSSDRLRRKPFLLFYELLLIFCSLAAFLSTRPLILTPAAILGGFGRGAMGAAGPFAPVEQAWLAEEVAPEKRGWVYSLNNGLGFWGMALGALFAILPSFRGEGPGHIQFYRLIFVLSAMTAAANLYLIARAREQYHGHRLVTDAGIKQKEAGRRRLENRILLKLLFINSFNGLAIGLTGPLMAYWFARRFQVGPLAIGPVMAATFAFTGASSMITGWLSGRIGLIQSMVWERLLGILLLGLLPLMPSYGLASAVYLLRSVFYRGAAGTQQALTVGLVRNERRGLATSLNAVSFQVPRSFGPGLAGYLFGAGQFSLPFYGAAILQTIYLFGYAIFFKGYEPPRENRIDPKASRENPIN